MLITKYRSGKPYEVDAQVLKWRKSMRRFRKLYREILKTVLVWHNGDLSQTEAWFKAPNAQLGGATPKSFVNPKFCYRLWKWVHNEARSIKPYRKPKN